VNSKGERPRYCHMWCVVELVRKIRARQEVLGLNLRHAIEGGLQDLNYFLVPKMGFNPDCMTGD
jgi:hypothetical protein